MGAVKNRLLIALLAWTASACTWMRAPDNAAVDASFKAFLPEWERAQTRFINGDPALWKQHASHRDDVTILGGFGGEGEKGWAAVGTRYDWASSQYQTGEATLKVDYLTIAVSGDRAFTVGIERQDGARVGNQAQMRRALRVTQVFRREDGSWKLMHRHADQVMEKQDPSAAPKK